MQGNTMAMKKTFYFLQIAFLIVGCIFALPPPNKDADTDKYLLSKDQACKDDVKKICPNVNKENNFAVFICLQDKARIDDDDVSDECQETLWHYKLNLTQDAKFDDAILKVCVAEFENTKLKEQCEHASNNKEPGFLMNCLIEHRQLIKDQKCSNFVNRMASIVFADYRLMHGFYKVCVEDVKKTKCGILSDPKDGQGALHEQSDVIGCLEANIDSISDQCQKQLLRVAELQADDYHLDRPLFYACQDARERYCHDVQAGEGRVYKCLLSHVNDEAMQEDCASKLRVREKLMQKSVKVNYALWKSCEDDFNKYNCGEMMKDKKTDIGEASWLLLCLKEQEAKGNKIAPKCLAEMKSFAVMIFENLQISHVVVANCDHEIKQYCEKVIDGDGEMMDCLMTAATNNSLSNQCFQAVSEVLKETGAGNNYKVDRALYKACEQIISSLCQDKEDMMILGCLIDNAHSPKMPEECATQIFHLQYFLARDFRLDTSLYQDCKNDAEKICSAADFQERTETKKGASLPDNFVIACLYRNSFNKASDEHKVSPQCSDHIRRVMHQRATNIRLMPELEQSCLADLGKYCIEKVNEGEEIDCLQQNYEQLSLKCKQVIGDFTQLEAKDFDLDKHLVDKCAKMVAQFCQRELEDGDGEMVLPCLVKHKNDVEMDHLCASAVEHWQLLEMKDFNFSPALKDKCLVDIRKLCQQSKSKFEAVKCLSEQIVKDHNTVSADCRSQVKNELLMQGENLKLNPELYKECKKDIEQFCADVPSYGAQLEECLRKNHNRLSSHKCKQLLFQTEKKEMEDNELDYRLIRTCKNEVSKFCSAQHMNNILSCLRRYVDHPDMTSECRQVVFERQIEQAESFELDYDLKANCQEDVKKYCQDEYNKAGSEGDNGAIFGCLLNAFLQKKKLKPQCESFVRQREREAAREVELNPQFLFHCRDEIDKLCPNLNHDDIIDCMKVHLPQIKSHGCKEEVKKIIMAGIEDVHVDPHLQEICAQDINTFCKEMPRKGGNVVLCLIDVHKAKNLHLKEECDNFLRQRIDIYKSSGVDGVIFDSISAVMDAVAASPHRSYIYMVLLIIISILFVCGILFGRFTKRVRAEIKNR